jgi:hypothetical protein
MVPVPLHHCQLRKVLSVFIFLLYTGFNEKIVSSVSMIAKYYLGMGQTIN